jgi:ABC-type multidrug transport system fused ATPase/permease subunit
MSRIQEARRSLLVRYLRPHVGSVCLLVVCLFASMGLQLFIPHIVRSFIDRAVEGAAVDALVRLGLAYLGLSIVIQMLGVASTYASADIGWRATNRLRIDLLRHTLSLDMSYHQKMMPGQMIERIDGDVGNIASFFSQFVVRVSMAVLMTLGVLVLLWRENWLVGLTLTLFTAVAMAVLHRRRSVAVGPTQQERELTARVFGFVEERLAGRDDIRANGAGRYVMHRFLELQREWYARASRAWWLRGTIWLSTSALFAVGYVVTLGLGVRLYLSGLITLGTVYLLFNYLLMLESPLDQITQQLQGFQSAAASMRRVRELFDTPCTILSGRARLSRQPHAIEFQCVRFRYGELDVLKSLSFRLEPGQTLGLLGRTGSGKTTLTRLAARIYDATEGRILIDDRDLRDLDLRDVRSRIALVTQDIQLFSGTIRDNLTFFNPRHRDERIWDALGRLHLQSWIAGLPRQLDTVLETGGSALSAGQAQLVALARAFLCDPGLVILDEPSSRLDPATERLTRRALDTLLEGRTGIVIAHRLETVERADTIMVLADGRIVEYGAREALAGDARSRYAKLRQLASASTDLDAQLQELA